MNLSYAHGVSNGPLIGRTIGDLLDEIVAEFGQKEALVSIFENKRFTWAAFQDEVNRCARAFMGMWWRAARRRSR